MPRRRIPKGRDNGSKPKAFKKSDGKAKKWNTRDDIPMDEEDQFHSNKDKILLEGDDGDHFDGDEDDDEVFALKGLESDSDNDEQHYEDEEEMEQQEEEVIPEKMKKASKSKKRSKAAEESNKSEEEEEEESWGKGRGAYYASNAYELESDDEEGNELEEQEAKRLQKKMREEMKDDDFGLDDNPELEKTTEAEDILDPAPSILPSIGTDKKSLLRHLEKTSPEALALARDWDETARNLQKTRDKITKLQAENLDTLSLGMIYLHYQALLSYSTTLAFYLHLRSSAKYSQRPALLQSHPILQRLLTLKQSLQTLEDLDFAPSDSEDEDEDEDSDFTGMDMSEILADGEKMWRMDDDDEEVDSDELADLLKDAKETAQISEQKTRKPPKKKRKTVEEDAEPKVVTPVFDLVEPQFTSSKSSSSRRQSAADSADAYGEDFSLHLVDAADKSARKKSLRFHTNKIESASARRQGARNAASGGDDDIPYRLRKKEKDARLVKEAAIRASNQIGAALDDEDPEPQVGDKRSREDDDGNESPDDYYELVKKRTKEEKSKKKVEYEEAHGLARVPLDDAEGAEGPRSLTRAILTNRGLTPHRPKSVRNPRVKKREKYEKAKKKISSQKAVYKGGLAETGGKYDGERSGISKVVKSVRLG